MSLCRSYYLVCSVDVEFVHLILIAGRKAYSLTWALQYVNLFMINTGYIILAGSALKVRDIWELPDHLLHSSIIIKVVKSSVWIIIASQFCFCGSAKTNTYAFPIMFLLCPAVLTV